MNTHRPQPLSERVLDEASRWFVELREDPASQEVREGFDAWLRASPEHVSAFLRIASHWEEGVGVVACPESIDELVTLARDESNVTPLFGAETRASRAEEAQSEARVRSATGKRVRLAALAASLVLVASAVTLVWYQHFHGLQATGIGEQRSLKLSDGSIVEVNALTRLRIRYTERERRIDLLEGQALFRVEKDSTRPFLVVSGDTQIRAVGTQFDVYRRPEGTTVTVIEGKVAVSQGRPLEEPGTADVPIVTAGEQIVATPEKLSEPHKVNITTATAWTQRRLIFSATPLATVVEEFNRYNAVPLVLEDPALADKKISGSFSSSDPTALLQFLEQVGDYKVEKTPDAVRISSR